MTRIKETAVQDAITLFAFCFLATCSGSEAALPATQTLRTSLDQAVFDADISPALVSWLTMYTAAPTGNAEMGKPYGYFTLEKGPRLVFTDSWEVPVATSAQNQAMVTVRREGELYEIVSIGAAELAVMLGEREKIPSVSSALNQGRAGLLRPASWGGIALLAYEIDGPLYPANIRVQPLGVQLSVFASLDSGVDGIPEASLAEINEALP